MTKAQDDPPGKEPALPSAPKKDMAGLFHGAQFAMTIILGLGAGYWLDGRFGWYPAATLTGFFAGAAAGMYQLYRAMK